MARKQYKMEENQEKRKLKKDKKKLEKKIISICENKGPGLLGPTLEKFRKSRFDYEQINRLLDKASPIKCLQLYKVQRSIKLVLLRENRYVFKRIYFIGHCLDHHRGLTPKDSQVININ